MKADLTRITFRAERHYSRVVSQQGRVALDADWNERDDIIAHRTESETRDTIGVSGGPLSAAGFGLGDKSGDLLIGAGHYYVDGILCENETAVLFSAQSDVPAASLPTAPGTYIAYLDVWQQHITALEDSSIREVALGGPDTTTRTRTVWQVKLLPVQTKTTCGSDPTNWVDAQDLADLLKAPGADIRFIQQIIMSSPPGKLSARAEPSLATNDPCMIEPGAGYRGLENQLYRVEIHDAGDLGNATFKWSRDNGSIAVSWLLKDGDDLTVSSLGRDPVLGFSEGQWVELTDDAHELLGLPGTLVRIVKADGLTLTLDPATATGPADLLQFPRNPKVRRWDMPSASGPITVEVPATNEGFIALEDGVEVKFDAGSFSTGDYWLIPARTATGGIEWPFTDAQPLHGIQHHYCRLAVLAFDRAAWTVLEDCRELFPQVTELTSLAYVSGDGQEAAPGALLLHPLQAGVSNGQSPVAGARVRFKVTSGGGKLQGGVTSTDVLTGADGVAACTWTLGTTPNQQVEATLLGRAGAPIHLPLRYNASFTTSAPPAPPGVRVTKLTLATGALLSNDTEIQVGDFAGGISVFCEEPIAPNTVKDRPTCFLTLEMPFPFNSADTGLWGSAVIGFTPLVLAATTDVNGLTLSWTPTKDTADWLTSKLFLTLNKEKKGDRILARLKLLGNFIWSEKDPSRFLDGDTFGKRGTLASGPTEVSLPSGDSQRGGNLEMWFWLIAEPAATPTVVIKPASATTTIPRPITFEVTVTGAANPAVELSVDGIPSGNQLVGTILPGTAPDTWIYRPPQIPPQKSVFVAAALVSDPTITAKALVTVESRLPRTRKRAARKPRKSGGE